MKNTKPLRDWITNLAAKGRITIAELARRTHIGASSYSRILKGTTIDVNSPTVEALCKYAGIEPGDLLDVSA